MDVQSATPDAPLRDAATEVVQRLRQHGHAAFWAGGAVRDLVRGVAPKDIDIATDAPPPRVQELFPGSLAIGRAFGVILVRHGGVDIEVATFRRDLAYADGRHPTAVVFAGAEEDARRRDFTINGMFFDPIDRRVIDYVGGESDLRARCIRAIGRPGARFAEDYLRMLRAVRFAAVLEFDIEPETANAIREHAPQIRHISAERIQQELTRMFCEAPKPSRALRGLSDLGLLGIVLPEVEAMRGVAQPPQFHPEGDVFEHTALMLDLLASRSPALVYAVLLHDVAKPPTFRVAIEPDGNERIRFDGHDRLGAEMTREILHRLRLPNDVIEPVVYAVRQHMRFMHVQEMRPGKLRQLVGAPTFELEMELHRVDCLSSHGDLGNYLFLREFQRQLAQEPALPTALVTGHDLIAFGMKAGPEMGAWLKRIYEAQLEGAFNDRAGGLGWLRERLNARDTGGHATD